MSYSFIAPLIFPVLPRSSGTTFLDMPIDALIRDAGLGLSTGDLKLTIERFESGRLRDEPETLLIRVRGGAPDLSVLSRVFEQEALGFATVSIESDIPFFRKITTEIVSSIVERPNGSLFNISANSKYAEPPVIRQIRETRKFCIVHTGNQVSQDENIGNSTLIINPFDGALVARLTSEEGRVLKRRIAPGESAWIRLDGFLPDGKWSGVTYTGSNRFPAWDVRHNLDDETYVHHVDHLEYYRGELTRLPLTPRGFVKEVARDALRALRLRDA